MFMLNFPNANVSSEEWCYVNNVSYGISAFVLKHVLEHVLRRKGRVLSYLAYTGHVCGAEHKVSSIKQGVEFTILIVKF